MRKLRVLVVLGLLVGIAAVVRRHLAGQGQHQTLALPPASVPVPALDVDAALGPDTQPLREPEVDVRTGVEAEVAAADRSRQPPQVAPEWQPELAGTWSAPEGAACPASHPVKAKLPSRIYHLPGMANYNRTVPDRCYADGATAEADGFRKAKR